MIRTILTGIGALSLVSITGFVLIVAVDAWCHRKGCRPTRHAPHRPHQGGGTGSVPAPSVTRARVGRPAPSMVFPECAVTIDELLSDLTTEGQMLLERERQL